MCQSSFLIPLDWKKILQSSITQLFYSQTVFINAILVLFYSDASVSVPKYGAICLNKGLLSDLFTVGALWCLYITFLCNQGRIKLFYILLEYDPKHMLWHYDFIGCRLAVWNPQIVFLFHICNSSGNKMVHFLLCWAIDIEAIHQSVCLLFVCLGNQTWFIQFKNVCCLFYHGGMLIPELGEKNPVNDMERNCDGWAWLIWEHGQSF